MGRPKQWKGRITRDLRSFGAFEAGAPPEFKKGDLVICTKRKVIDDNNFWNGEYEYHYRPADGSLNLVRTSDFLIEAE